MSEAVDEGQLIEKFTFRPKSTCDVAEFVLLSKIIWPTGEL